jgi:alpha 1,2-mannosyltransferase
LLNNSINLLKNNFINLDKVDILIFHEESLRPALPFISQLHPNIKFEEIEFKLPDFYKNFNIPESFPNPVNSNHFFNMGYRHMCRFFSGEIFKHPAMQKYDNYLRLDTDSFIHKMDFDLFEFIEKNNIYYGYIEESVQYDEPGEQLVYGFS